MLDSTTEHWKLDLRAVDVGCVPGARPRYNAGICRGAEVRRARLSRCAALS